MDLGRGGRPTRLAMRASVDLVVQIEAEPNSCLTRVLRGGAENPARHSRHGSRRALVGPTAIPRAATCEIQHRGRGALPCERSDPEHERTPADEDGSHSNDPDDSEPPRT